MSKRAFLAAAVALAAGPPVSAQGTAVTVVRRPDTAKTNPWYPGNKAPLLPSPFIRLPTGAVKPQGWLRKQLQLQADGYLGHLAEVSGYLRKENNAWLDPAGKGDAFWEEVPYWLRGYVSLAYLLEDPKLITEAKTWLEPSIVGQRANGYFGTEALSGGGRDAPDLMPHQNMLYAYRSYYDATGDKRVLDLMTRFFHWELTLPDSRFFNGGWGAARNSDNMDMAYWLYNRTGDPKLLELGEKLMRTGDRWMGRLTGVHNVAYSQGFRKPGVFYQQNLDPKYLARMESNYHDIYDVYGQVPGGMFGGDEFARPGHTDPQQAIETCGAVEMMFSSQILLRVTGDLKWMDRCENIAYNTLPATTTADMRGLRYLTSPNQTNSDARTKAPTLANDGFMQVMNPRDHHCCQHNLSCAWPYFAENLYQATPDKGLAAMMYAPCKVSAKVGDGTKVTLEQNTRYPFEERVELLLITPKKVSFPLYLRVPAWCAAPRLTVNGKPVALKAKGGDLVRVARTWTNGDKLLLDLPMAVRVTRWEKNKDAASLERGPLTFSVKFAENYVPQYPERKDDKWPALEIKPGSPWNYGLVLEGVRPAGLEVVKKPFPANNTPFTQDGAPVELRVRAKRIPEWTENYFGVVDRLQPSPIRSEEPAETITMLPMGATRLRMTALPVVGDGPVAKPWQKTKEPISSWSEDAGILSRLTDPRDPKSSDDGSVGMFLMYGNSLFGSQQWIRMPFEAPRTVSRCKTYWWTEHYENGGVREPASWRILYKDGDTWKPVPNPSGYPVEKDRYNEVTFDPVTTSELKLEVQFQQGRCGALIRWRVE